MSLFTEERKALELPHFLQSRINAYYTDRVNKSWNGNHIMRGKIPGENAVQLLSNDYLNLVCHKQILEAQKALLTEGYKAHFMSPIFLHGENPQSALEQDFSRFLNCEETLLCQSGYAANVGLIQSIADESTPVYIDMIAHLSLWEGVKSAGAKAYPFPHNNMDRLESRIQKNGPGIVIIDSVYSINGSIAPLAKVVSLAEQYGCILVVDESHSLGTHGPAGSGLVEALGLTRKVHFRTASLAKAFVARAGIITCSHEFADYFRFTSNPAIFSSALVPHEIAGIHKTLQVIAHADERRKRLQESSAFLRSSLSTMGYNLNGSNSQIIALESGTESTTIQLRDALEARDIFGAIFCAPATPQKRAVMRFSINAGLTDEQLIRIVDACYDIRDEVAMHEWPSTLRLQRQLETC